LAIYYRTYWVVFFLNKYDTSEEIWSRRVSLHSVQKVIEKFIDLLGRPGIWTLIQRYMKEI